MSGWTDRTGHESRQRNNRTRKRWQWASRFRPAGRSVAIGVLLTAVVASALSVAYVAQLSRHLFNRLETDHRTAGQMQARFSRLLLERGALASHSRIERIARQKLGMRVPKPDDIVVVNNR